MASRDLRKYLEGYVGEHVEIFRGIESQPFYEGTLSIGSETLSVSRASEVVGVLPASLAITELEVLDVKGYNGRVGIFMHQNYQNEKTDNAGESR